MESVLDLYSGMGGLGTGFAKYFNVLDAVDYNQIACQTYQMNHPKTNVHYSPVTEFIDNSIRKDFDAIVYNGVIGGPPCQEFSKLNRFKNPNSIRAKQVLVFLDAVDVIQPDFAFIENVPRIPVELKNYAAKRLKTLGYKVTQRQIIAYNYGSIQLRPRWILTASKRFHIFPNPLSNNRVAREFENNNLPSYMQMSEEIRSQLKTLPKGKWVALPGKNWKEYFILDPNRPFPAIVNVMKNRIVKSDCSGYVSLEIIKQAQGFPLDYRIAGKLTAMAQQLANAVPVEMAESFAKAFFKKYHPDKSNMLYWNRRLN